MKKILNTLILFFYKFFTPTNFSKIIVIFTFGIVSRYLVNEYFNINVFIEYLTLISITYYSVFASFIVIVHEVFTTFNINIIPTFIIELFSKIGSVLNHIFIKSFIHLYSMTLGKYPYISYINNPKNYKMVNNDYYDSKYYSGNTQISQNNNGYYGITPNNPYYENGNSLTNHGNHKNTTQSQLYDHLMKECGQGTQMFSNLSRNYYTPSIYNDQFEDSFHTTKENINANSSNLYNNQYTNISEPRFFIVDSINNNGMNKNINTPNMDTPFAPKPSNLTTPSTMTPLFGSVNNTPNISCESVAYTNSTNHGTIGHNRSETYINWEARKYRVGRAFEEIVQPTLQREVDVPTNAVRGKVSLGVEYIYDKKNIRSLYIKYHDIAKRKFFWNIWEKGRDNYETYEEFKANFNPKTNIWKEIAKTTRTDLSNEVRDLLKTDPFKSRRPQLSTKDIRRIPNSSIDSRLNHINARKNKSITIPSNKRKV